MGGGRRLTAIAAAALLGCAALGGCAHRTQIGGTITTTDFTLPAGHVATATSDLTIKASHRIEIKGMLYVARGAHVTFIAPRVEVTGRVQYLPMHVSWWRRSKFELSRVPVVVEARVDRLLGRSPNYWARGPLDCFNPAGRAAALATPGAVGKANGPRQPS